MPGIDRFLSKSLENAMKKNLNAKTEYKMKRMMFEKYGLSIRQSVEDIEKLHQVRKEILSETDYMPLKKFIQKICSIEKTSDGRSYDITILDETLKETFLQRLGDDESREIVTEMMGKMYPNSEVLALLKISTTSGYRKINILIRDGLLIKTKYKMLESRRSVEQYTAFCDKIFLEMKKDKIILKIQVSKKRVESSSIFKIYETN